MMQAIREYNTGKYRVGLVAVILIVICAFAVIAVRCTAEQKKPRLISVIYSNQAYGLIRSCNCTKFRYGGYGRQASFLDKLSADKIDTVAIEGGDSIAINTTQEQLKAGVALKATDALGYAAYVPGETEIAFGLDKFIELNASLDTPIVAANVTSREPDKIKINRYIIHKTSGGLKIGITGVFGPQLTPKLPGKDISVEITDVMASLDKLIPELRPKCDLLIVAAHCNSDTAKKIAEKNKVDLVILSHTTEGPVMPEKNANVVEVPFNNIGKVVYIESRTRNNWCVGKLDLERGADGAWKAKSNKLHYLDREYEEHPRIVKIYDEYNEAIREITLKQQSEMKAKIEKKLRDRGYDPEKMRKDRRNIVGAEKCADCHKEDHDIWSKSAHSKAIESLKKTKQEFDPECVSCHTTGFNDPYGFTNMKETPELANVQCEVCHGPGKAHVAKPDKGYGFTGEENCRSCHTDEIHPDFDYESKWQVIKH